ncbi:alpha/beta hydrolase [Streptomyces sp. NPDC057199]|uniref:alpha/beta hydrolase n=1 Tax=Streptomyces sp. NPDC057199 TaxID=3346047 RepID=UPI003627804D
MTGYRLMRSLGEEGGAVIASYESQTSMDRRDATAPGVGDAPDVRVRVYGPAEREGLLYIHGGGFIMGSVDRFDATAMRIAAEVGAVVVSVEHRLAPENPLRAGLEDCYAALVWTAKSAGELGIDPQRIGVAGERGACRCGDAHGTGWWWTRVVLPVSGGSRARRSS